MIDVTEVVFIGLAWVCIAAWKTAPLFLIVLLLSSLFHKRIPARALCFLWLLVVVRLLLPFSIGSPVAMSPGVNGLLDKWHLHQPPARADFLTDIPQNENRNSVRGRQPNPPADASHWPAAQVPTEVVRAERVTRDIGSSRVAVDKIAVSIFDTAVAVAGYALPWTWVAGLAFFLCRKLIAYFRFSRRLRRVDAIEDQPVVDRVLRACDRVGVGRRPQIKEVRSLGAPAVFGLFRPVICLPADWHEQLSGDRFDWVLRHELAHVRRRDGIVLFVAGIARSLHWFHPLSWIAFSKLQYAIERAADELATRDLSEAGMREYGKVLLKYATVQNQPRHTATSGLLAMASPRTLQRRIESLTAQRTKYRWVVRGTVAPILLLIAVSGLTDAKTIEPTIQAPRTIPNIEVALAEAELPSIAATLAEKNDRRSARLTKVDVKEALRKAAELQPRVDAERFVMTYFARYPDCAADHATTRIVGGVMTTMATPQQEALMKQMLAAFVKSGPWQIVTDLRVVETDVRLLNQVDWSISDPETHCKRLNEPPSVLSPDRWEAAFALGSSTMQEPSSTPSAVEQYVSLPVRTAKITRLESERLLNRIQSDARSNVLQAPKVTMFNGQSGIISDIVKRPFVTDVSLVRGDFASAVQPKISVFESGWKFQLKPTATDDVRVDLQLVISQSSINSVRLANLPGMSADRPQAEVTIQVPSVISDSIAVQSHLAPDEALLIFTPKPYAVDNTDARSSREQGKGQVFLIRTQLMSDMDFLKSFVPKYEQP